MLGRYGINTELIGVMKSDIRVRFSKVGVRKQLGDKQYCFCTSEWFIKFLSTVHFSLCLSDDSLGYCLERPDESRRV